MNSTRQQNKFSRFMRTHAALLIIVFCVLAITAVVLAVTLTKSDPVIPDDPVVSNPNDDDDPNKDKPQEPTEKEKVKIYFRKPVEYVDVGLEYTSGIDDDLFVFNPTLGWWATHYAVDLAANDGTEVVAMYDGLVVDVDEDVQMGYYVTIDHGEGVVATYASLSNVQVIEGQQVKQGDTLGSVSTSMGNECENGAHLHLEVYKDDVVVDPMPYVNGEIYREVEKD
ncbi:MAG: M23 family metallopeptidase [Clostridiales bacterium]|nr:M23 family metallopeptidase [Clostridiales bacterium]